MENPNKYPGLVAPNVHAAKGTMEQAKFNINAEFDREPFTATLKEYKVDRHRNVKTDKSGKPVYEEKIRQKGRPKLIWLEQNKLNTESHPAEWFDPFLPTSARAHDPCNAMNLDQWTNYTNMKAFIAQASGVLHVLQ